MAKSNNQKAKILYLKEMLEAAGESRPVGMQEILDRLLKKGIQAERKSIYDDIEVLRSFGMDVKYRRGKQGGYYVADQRDGKASAFEETVCQQGAADPAKTPAQEARISQRQAKAPAESSVSKQEMKAPAEQTPDRRSWKDKKKAKQHPEKQMKLRCDSGMRKQVREYFGGDARYVEKEPGYFTVTTGLLEGPEFYGWLCFMGKGVHILKPKRAAQSYREYLKTLAREYKGIS